MLHNRKASTHLYNKEAAYLITDEVQLLQLTGRGYLPLSISYTHVCSSSELSNTLQWNRIIKGHSGDVS